MNKTPDPRDLVRDQMEMDENEPSDLGRPSHLHLDSESETHSPRPVSSHLKNTRFQRWDEAYFKLFFRASHTTQARDEELQHFTKHLDDSHYAPLVNQQDELNL